MHLPLIPITTYIRYGLVPQPCGRAWERKTPLPFPRGSVDSSRGAATSRIKSLTTLWRLNNNRSLLMRSPSIMVPLAS